MKSNHNPYIENSLHVFENVDITNPLSFTPGSKQELITHLRQLADDIESGEVTRLTQTSAVVRNDTAVQMSQHNYSSEPLHQCLEYNLNFVMDTSEDAETLLTSLFVDLTPSLTEYPDKTIQINLEPAGIVDDAEEIPVITIIPKGETNDTL